MDEEKNELIDKALCTPEGVKAILQAAFKDDNYDFAGINYNKLIKFPEGRLEAFEKWYGRDTPPTIDHDALKSGFMAGWNALKNLLEREHG